MLYYILVPLAWVLAHIVFRPQVIGRENLIKGRGFILAPNHRSALDPVFIVLSDGYFWLHKMRIFAKKELFQGKPLLAWFLRQMGAVSVKNGRDDLSTLDNTKIECIPTSFATVETTISHSTKSNPPSCNCRKH